MDRAFFVLLFHFKWSLRRLHDDGVIASSHDCKSIDGSENHAPTVWLFAVESAASGGLTCRVALACGLLSAVVKKNLPLLVRDRAAERFMVVTTVGPFTHIDKAVRVPRLIPRPDRCGGCQRVGCLIGLDCKRGKDSMLADSPEPVFGISKIGFPAMHHAMPIAAARRGNSLADRMGFIEEIEPQPHCGEAAVSHGRIHNRAATAQVRMAEQSQRWLDRTLR